MNAQLSLSRIEPRLSADPVSEPDYLVTTFDGKNIGQSMRYSDADIAEYGIDRVRKWVAEDQARYEAWRRDEWNFTDLRLVAVIEVSAGGQQIGTLQIDGPSLGGIESDAGSEYMLSVVGELVEEFRPELIELGFGDANHVVPAEIVEGQ